MSTLSQRLIRVDHATPTRPSGIISYRTVGLFVGILDLILIIGSSVVAGVVYHLIAYDHIGSLSAFVGIGGNSAALFILLMALRGMYQTPAVLSIGKQFRGVVSVWFVVALAVLLLLFLLKISEVYSRGSIVGFEILGLCALLGSRAAFASKLNGMMAREALAGDRTIVLGDREELARVSSLYLLRKYGSLEVGRFELPPADRYQLSEVRHQLRVVDAAIDAARSHGVEKVLLALPWGDVGRRRLICGRLRSLPVSVMLLPDRFADPIISRAKLGPDSEIQIEVQRAPLSRVELAVKRAFDLAFATVGLLVLAPLLVLTCLMIRFDSQGPIVFRQDRRGFNGKQFVIYKFRTMKVLENGDAVRQAERNDDRVTRVGRILRTTSIDELPQLVNVLLGDMSLIGPRPHALVHDSKYAKLVANYANRHHVKPGITGWAQVNGFRGETAEIDSMKNRVSLDLWYINNWSFWLDLKILGLTCIEVVRGQNAY